MERVELAHINNRFVYQGDDDYQGLFTFADITEKVRKLLPHVPAWVDMCRSTLAGPCPETEPGDQCNTPWQEFCLKDTVEPEFPLHFLP